jgi:hypothetical protein
MRTRITPTLLLVALLGMLACGGGDKSAQTKPEGGDSAQSPAPAASSAKSHAALTGCGWITEAEAGTALGAPMKYRGYDPKSSNCVLEPIVPEGDFGLSVDFSIREGSGVYDYTSKGGKGETLSGLGDRAVWAPSALLNTLVVVKGNRELDMSFANLGKKTPDMRERAITLAKVIVAKM